MKRKFNSQRLYKLTRFLVVLISIISAFMLSRQTDEQEDRQKHETRGRGDWCARGCS